VRLALVALLALPAAAGAATVERKGLRNARH
jgi:hypothetical protein